jgi:hypothetical protein
MECQLHAWALIIRIEESDYHSATQSLDRNPVFGREFLTVFGEDMSLDVTWTSPLETTEQAVLWSLVYVLPVPCELLCTPKAFAAIGTDSPHLAVHVTSTTAAVRPVGALDSYMPSESGSVGTSLRYFNSDHEKTRRCSPRTSTIGVAAPLVIEPERQLFQGLDPWSGHRAALGRCNSRQYVAPPH